MNNTTTSRERRSRPRRSLHEREALVELWDRSDERTDLFCAKHDISLDSFNRWRSEFDRRRRSGAPVDVTPQATEHNDRSSSSFIELRPSPTALSTLESPPLAPAEVVLVARDGLRIELRGESAREVMVQLVTLIGGRA